ncbi:SDR family NAD(P)-dependent oxidoreductase [Aspergillus stella-maris]|uniref:SDR family NAD(P)-dependent oxidoreductase n=1 Tax=Aspergillus stella-maris TaxID=1810926 RepID=UPI003CCD0416
MPEQTLLNKVAIITGSSSGIGASIAHELSSRGANVVINYPFAHLKSEASSLAAMLPSPSITVQADLSQPHAPETLISAALQEWNRIDILINCAGIAVNKPIEEQTLEDWDRIVNLNGRGTFLMTKAVLPHLLQMAGGGCGDGRIVNIASISARGPPPNQTIYAGSKGMVDSFTKCWAKELPPKYGCTVNSVSPGPTMTEGFAAAAEEQMKILQPIIDQTPVGPRMAQPEEIAYAVAFLCEERARWINGVHLVASGGLFID